MTGRDQARRSDPEQIQNHQLAVVIPPPLEKSGFRLPAVRQDARMPGQHPLKIYATIDRIGRSHDSRIVFETPSYGEDAPQ